MKLHFTRSFFIGLLFSTLPALANLPGGGTNGPNVTLTDNGTTVTLANGIVSILCTKAGSTIHQINYTYNNTGTPRRNRCSPVDTTAGSCIGKTVATRD